MKIILEHVSLIEKYSAETENPNIINSVIGKKI